MKINTGKGFISLWALLGIWSVSALTSLPGLAISPIAEKLVSIFPTATDVEIQLLTTLPSLLIIPFILWAGYISDRIGYIRLLYIGLVLFLFSGALYFVCGSMTQLIAVSALLGVGAGIIVPLSTSLVSRFFAGEERTRQYGYVSAINNIALVVATAITGWLADIQWRLPFLVYLLPIFSILLVPLIKRDEGGVADTKSATGKDSGASGIDYGRLIKYMLYYFLATYLVMVVSIDLPFLLGERGHDSAVSGIVIAVFFVAIMLPGLFVNRLIAFLGKNLLMWAMLLVSLGLLDVFFNSSLLFVVIGCVAAGFGYGMAQPYIYDVTSSLAPPQKVTFTLALLMTMNYVAILVCPFIVEGAQDLIGAKGVRFPFLLNGIIGLLATAILVVRSFSVRNK